MSPTPIMEDSKPPARSHAPSLPIRRPPPVEKLPPPPERSDSAARSHDGELTNEAPSEGKLPPETHNDEEPKDENSNSVVKDGAVLLETQKSEALNEENGVSVANDGAAPPEAHKVEEPKDTSNDSAPNEEAVPPETHKGEERMDTSSETNDGGTAPSEANEAGTEQIQNSLRPLMAGENPEQRASRKRKLFSLFRSYDNTKFNELAEKAEVQPISDLLNSRKKAATFFVKSQVALGLPPAVALFPSPSAKAPPTPPVAKKLRQLEKETLSGGQAKQKPLRTFSLQFLDCSIAAIVRWSAGTGQGNGRQRTKKTTSCHSAVASNFRKCGVCGDWGHYETQCAHIKPVELHRVRPYAPEKKQQALKKTEITVERCNDFLIEQRSDPRPVDSSEKTSMRPRNDNEDVVETAVDNLGIKSSSRHPDFAVAFSEGDAVAWSSKDGAVLAGKVEHVDSVRGLIKAQCLYSISSNPSGDTTSSADICMVFTLPGKCVRPARRSQSNKFEAKKLKSVPISSKKRRHAKLLNRDGTIRSTTTPLLLYDGTYKKPRGRNPDNMTWCIKRGVWKPLG